MAKQINFYSVSALPSSVDSGGIYFSAPTTGATSQTTGEIYKGSQRFGAPRVTIYSSGTGGISNISSISNMIRGDVFISDKDTYIYDGLTWNLVKVDHNANLSAVASAYVAGLVAGNSTSSPSTFIQYITQDSTTGKVTAHESQLPTLNLGLTTKSGSSNGVTVSVTTQSGAVTGVTVAAPAYTATEATKSSSNNGTTVSVTTKNGQVTAVSVTASNWTPGTSTKSGSSNSIQVDVTTTSGVVTAVVVSNPFVATEVTKSGTSNGVTVSVTTKNGQVTAVAVAASEIANVMHFKGTSTTLPSWGESTTQKAGDIWIVGANPTGYITSSGWGSTTSTGNTKLVAGQEYVKTSSGGFELIGDQNTYATKAYVDAEKADIGSSNSTLKGLKGAIELKSNSTPTIALTDNGLATKASDITISADKLVTASAVANYISGKLPPSGFGTAATYDVTTNTITDGGVSLPTENAVYDFVDTQIGNLDSTVASTSGPVTVNVTQTDGMLTACTVTWAASNNGVTGGSNQSSAWTNGPWVSVKTAATTAAPTVTLGGWGSAAAKSVVTASGSFKTSPYGGYLPEASAVAAYVDGKIGDLDSTVTSSNGGLSIAVTQTDGKLTSCACQFVWLDGTGAIIP